MPIVKGQPALILASSSPYRKKLLARLQLPFACISPGINETAGKHETAEQLVIRLAREKAERIARDYDNAIIIGSDQVLRLGEKILSKPGNHAGAVKQLELISGNQVNFLTGLCVLNAATKTCQTACISYRVTFRKLDNNEIERYLVKEKPYDCAGSFKSEALGVTLMSETGEGDSTALIGLPLIKLAEMLRKEGFELP